MKASALRLGNYIQDLNGIEVVNSLLNIVNYNINDSFGEDSFIGIPLSQEWLIKSGFVDNKIMLPGDGELEIRLKGGTFHIWPADGQTESYNYRNHINYVHELQNLYFALTGEELTIKEPEV